MKRVPRVLYHYCTLSTFKNIIDNKSVWLSDIRRSNDSLELKWIMGQCRDYIILSWANYINAVNQKRGEDVVTLDHLRKFDEIYKLTKSYDAEEDAKNWVFCLSEKADDLGQWRGYADDGKGIALGFNSAFLKNINILGSAIRNESVDFKFDKVRYSKKEVKDAFDKISGLEKINVDLSPEETIKYITRAVGYSYMFAPLHKSEKFEEEKEWRIFYTMYLDDLKKGEIPGIDPGNNRFSDILTLGKYAFTLKGENLVSHLELGFPEIKKAIHSVTIGPKAKVTVQDIKLYLISVGLLKNMDDKSI